MSNCSICIELVDPSDFKLSCGHVFHNKCITYWLLSNNTCPTCRKMIIYSDNEEDDELSQTYIFINKYNIPIHTIFNIQTDSVYEVDLFFEKNGTVIRGGEQIINLYSRYKTNGTSYECRFSIRIIQVNGSYFIIVKIEHLLVFIKTSKKKNKFIFKNKTKRSLHKSKIYLFTR